MRQLIIARKDLQMSPGKLAAQCCHASLAFLTDPIGMGPVSYTHLDVYKRQIKTRDQLHLPVPEAKFETVVVKPSDIQKEMVQNLSERAAKVHSGTVDASEDNMLCITNDGRKIGLDQRLMNPLLPDDPASKLNACVRNVLQIWEDGREQKLTQLLFCDLSTPKNDGQFNVYDDIKTKLLAAGVPESEVAFIHSADTEAKKRRHCSPKCAPAMCGFCWAALQKWVQAPMCRTGLWRFIIWMSAGNPVI